MKLAIMQPYFFPYIGYFQLISAVDKFIVYDDIEYTKKGWINRNRILMNGKDFLFTLPLKKDSDFLSINKRFLADSYPSDKKKLIGQIQSAYSKSPGFATVFPVIEECLNFPDTNLFNFILNSILKVCHYLDIKTEIILSSSLEIDPRLKGEKKVIAINKKMNSSVYINAIGGQSLYSREEFLKNQIDLKFIQTMPVQYSQFQNEFVPNLSIIDVMMFNTREKIHEYLDSFYSLI
jgi:hypothetical protein